MDRTFFTRLSSDLPASLVVFLVAVPLCLGIALASGAPLASGLIAGIVGGIVVGAASGSALGVSGPAAGLAVIVTHGHPDPGLVGDLPAGRGDGRSDFSWRSDFCAPGSSVTTSRRRSSWAC